MAVRSKRLWGPTAVGTGNTVVYTCPAGETALLKHISLANVTALSQTLRLRLNGTNQTDNIVDVAIPSTSAIQLTDLFIVLHPGDVLRAISSSANCIVTGYGAELEGVAD